MPGTMASQAMFTPGMKADFAYTLRMAAGKSSSRLYAMILRTEASHLALLVACCLGCSQNAGSANATARRGETAGELDAAQGNVATGTDGGGGNGPTDGSSPITSADASGNQPSSPQDPCSIDALREPVAATTYYVATGEPGADNVMCDGLAPSNQGAGHCPFKDFSSPTTRGLLDGKKSTRVEVRAGTYIVTGWDGLRVTGIGASDAERVVLSAYPGEHPVLEVGSPDGAGCDAATAMTTPACVREVIRISGSYTVVQGLTIQNGLGYHVEVTGGAHHLFRCNTLHETVAFPMRSDCLKLDGGASDIEILHNDFSRFRSQAIDMTNVSDVLIEDNDIHDPIDADAGATGTKFGGRDITIRNNRIHDFGDDPKMHAFSLGGTGTMHPDDHEAYAVHIESNRVWNIVGKLAQVVSCVDCSIENNVLLSAGAGVIVSASATGQPECGASANGCGPSTGLSIRGNRMRALDGGGDATQANVFIFVEAGEQTGLSASKNLYCAPTPATARFGWLSALLDFDAWVKASGTDADSTTVASSDPQCTSF